MTREEILTDHELAKIADYWVKSVPIMNLGIRTAFAAGYRLADQQTASLQARIKELEEQLLASEAEADEWFNLFNDRYPDEVCIILNKKI